MPDTAATSPTGPTPRLLERARHAARLRHLSRSTERAYLSWVKRFVRYHKLRHPESMGEAQAREFLTDLAVERSVSASTQKRALSALLFLYRDVLGTGLDWIDGIPKPREPRKLPVVVTREETRAVRQRDRRPPRTGSQGPENGAATSARRTTA